MAPRVLGAASELQICRFLSRLARFVLFSPASHLISGCVQSRVWSECFGLRPDPPQLSKVLTVGTFYLNEQREEE